jgi:hypothetical protein
MSTATSKLKPKDDVIALFRYSAEVQAIGVVEANGMVSLHGHDATHRGKRLPLVASDQDLNPERSPLFSFGVEAARRTILSSSRLQLVAGRPGLETYSAMFAVRGFQAAGSTDQAVSLMKQTRVYPLAQASSPPPWNS